jgi:anthranilate phosphoribosyltransferase
MYSATLLIWSSNAAMAFQLSRHARSLQTGTSIAEKTIQDLMVLWVLLIIEGLNCEIIVGVLW